MKDRFIVFDVETPNLNNDRISAIGISVVEDGKIVDDFFTLVDPEVHFDAFNIRLTGISEEIVEGAPTFPQLWKAIAPLMESGLPVAHNAPFDMGVLAKCLNAYNIEWKPWVRYACTVRMSRACIPEAPNHKLNTLCDWLGLELLHHNAGSDAHAAAEILCYCLRHGVQVKDHIRTCRIAPKK